MYKVQAHLASNARGSRIVDDDDSTAQRWEDSTAMAAQHGDGSIAGGNGYARDRIAGSDDSEDCGCCVGCRLISLTVGWTQRRRRQA